MKRMTTLLLALAVCAALCGCWAQQPSVPGQPEGTTTPEVGQAAPQSSAAPSAAATATPDSRLMQSKTYQYFSTRTSGDYTMTLRTQTDAGTRTTTTAVVNGRTVYSDITTDTGRFTNFEKDGKNYTVMHDTQTYLVTDAANVTQEDDGKSALSAGALHGEQMEEGTVSIDGTEYAYEQFSIGGAVVRYCFDGSDLKYILTNEDGVEMQMEVLSIAGEVSPSLFEVPEGYQKIG